MTDSLNIPRVVHIYYEDIKGLKVNELEGFIKNHFGKIGIKFIRLKEDVVSTKGLLFDPIKTKSVFDKLTIRNNETCHIILTQRLLATYDEDERLHIRAAIYSFPSIISLSGIVEGPAKPKDYYIYKERFSKLGIWPIEEPKIKKKFKLRFIDYGDKRINEVLKGYISQAIFFYMTGEPFCTNKRCRLFNSHWQEDLIYSQIKIGKFCSNHRNILKKNILPRVMCSF